jgi:hypothetical protein
MSQRVQAKDLNQVIRDVLESSVMNIDTDTLRRIQESRKMALGKPRKPLSKVDEGDEGV